MGSNPFLSLKIQISCLLQARKSSKSRQPSSVDSLWNEYVTWYQHTVKCTVQVLTTQFKRWTSLAINVWVLVYELSGCCFESRFSIYLCLCYDNGILIININTFSVNFLVQLGLNQRSVLSPLLLIIMLKVLTGEIRSECLEELF